MVLPNVRASIITSNQQEWLLVSLSWLVAASSFAVSTFRFVVDYSDSLSGIPDLLCTSLRCYTV